MSVTLTSPDHIQNTKSPFILLNREDWQYILADLQALSATDSNIDGGAPEMNYLAIQNYDGGTP